ncbi:MAG: Fe(2+) transporter permease subunit FeoB [Gammaproteobacteria bacterium]
MSRFTIGLIGNPNCGKTTLFNALTGSRQKVGNWPGVTVERKVGQFEHDGHTVEVVDLPGTYSLDAASSASLDEAIARDYALSGEASLIVNIVDASNLERNLYLTVQLIEMRVPVVLALNMLDMAAEAGITVDPEQLAEAIGCPVVPLVAAKGRGVAELKDAVLEAVTSGHTHTTEIGYAPLIEEALTELTPLVERVATSHGVEARWLALKLLENDVQAEEWIEAEVLEAVQARQAQIEERTEEEADVWVADARYGFIHEVVQEAVKRQGEVRRTLTDRIDRVVLNRFLGIPLFMLVMYLLFVVSFNGGNIFLDFFDQTAKLLFVDTPGHYLQAWGSPDWLTSLVTSVGGAIEIVSTFIAPIGMTFLFLSILEDSGYMARAAFVMDRFMRKIGLPGKAFVPMIVGFGCNVPAVMATRTLEDRRERLIAALMQPFMSCSARLVVYMAFVAVFFREYGGQIVFGLYVLGIVVAIFTAFILKRTALKGEATPFVMELPRYHIPTLRGVLRTTWDRLSVFILRVGKVIILAAVVVNLLGSIGLGKDGVKSAAIGDSVLADIGRVVTPVFEPMGISKENWPATVGLLSGVVVKEIVVGTLNGVYDQLGAEQAPAAPPYDFGRDLKGALRTIPENTRAFFGGFLDPLGFSDIKGAESNLEEAAQHTGASTNTLREMGRLFTVPGAVAYLIFVLLYIPCVNTMAAIRRETGSRAWTTFATLWGIGMGYGLAVGYYQLATLNSHPLQSLVWVTVIVAVLGLAILGLRRYGARLDRIPAVAT